MTSIAELWQQRFGSRFVSPELGAEDAQTVDSADTLALLLRHRTHRRYQERSIPPAVVDTLLGCTLSAASKSDLQQASILVVEDEVKRAAIADLIPSMPWVRKAPAFFVFLADGHRIEKICQLRGRPFANDNLDNFLSAVSDASLALQNCVIAAHALGLGCCPISVLRNHMAAVAQILALPQRVVPLAGLCLGYPAQEGFVSLRLPQSITVHRDAYDDSAFEQELTSYDSERDARYSIPQDNQKYPERFGIDGFYGWSEDKARQMAVEERANVGDYVHENGFSLGHGK